jgi:hypothetical protein
MASLRRRSDRIGLRRSTPRRDDGRVDAKRAIGPLDQ